MTGALRREIRPGDARPVGASTVRSSEDGILARVVSALIGRRQRHADARIDSMPVPDARAVGDPPLVFALLEGVEVAEAVDEILIAADLGTSDVMGFGVGLSEGVPGDFIETGVWRGGVTILMRAILEAYGVDDRDVWVADSFDGLPVPNGNDYPADAHIDWSDVQVLKVDADDVRDNFRRYGLLDDHVRLLEGWFSDTLPTAPIEALAVLRLDGDLYESTIDALTSLEPKVSKGGFVIVDDYGGWAPCRKAVDDYRADRGIDDPINTIDWTGVWWQKGLP